jgi:hypothetical protein
MQGYQDMSGQPSAYKDVVAELDPLDVDGLLSKCFSATKLFNIKLRRKLAIYLEFMGCSRNLKS